MEVNSGLRGIDVFLSCMVAVCGLIQLYLMNISSSPPLLWSWNILAIIGFLMGVVRHKILDYSESNRDHRTYFIGFLLILNIILFGIWLSFPITDIESVFAGGFVLTMMNFEESTWFILLNLGERDEADTTSS
jgi:hypothetical protein